MENLLSKQINWRHSKFAMPNLAFLSKAKFSQMTIRNMNKKFFIFVISTFLSLILSQQSYGQDWQGLLPIKSTKQDVEDLFGKPENKINGFGEYKTENETISVWYSIGNCKTEKGLNWNVSKDVVTTISVRMEKKFLLKSIEWDINQYSKRTHPIDESRFFYTSPDESVSIQTFVNENSKKEEILYIEFRPGNQYTHLLCKSSK